MRMCEYRASLVLAAGLGGFPVDENHDKPELVHRLILTGGAKHSRAMDGCGR
jgi:hypothetical protein